MELERCTKILWILWASVSVGGSFVLEDCEYTGVDIELTGQRTQDHFEVTCVGLTPADIVSWDVEEPDPEVKGRHIADCGQCSGTPCQPCSSNIENIFVSRKTDVSTVLIPHTAANINGGTITCQTTNGHKASCKMKIYSIPGCIEGELDVVVPARTNRQIEIHCEGLDALDEITWYITDNGVSRPVASCSDCSSCRCEKKEDGFWVMRHEQHSTMKTTVLSVANKTVRCRNDDSRTEAYCKIRAVPYSIRGCTDGGLEVVLPTTTNRQTEIHCDGLDATDEITWYIRDSWGDRPVASCSDCSSCHCEMKEDGFRVMRHEQNSTMTITDVLSVVNKTVRCKKDGSRTEAYCKIRVVHRGTIERAAVTLTGWNLIGSASVSNMYASDNNIVCRWTIDHETKSIPIVTRPELLSQDMSSGLPISHGECRLNVTISQIYISDGTYDVHLELVPGYGKTKAGSIFIKAPSSLVLDVNTCPGFVPEGDDLNCKCSHVPNRGSPRPKVDWVDRPGQQIRLKIKNVTRNMDGTVFTCRSSWLLEETLHEQNYTLHVAYGPDNVSLRVFSEDTAVNKVTYICTAHDVSPKAVFTWNIPCLNDTLTPSTSTCNVGLNLTSGYSEIFCTAYNSEHLEFNKKAYYKKVKASGSNTTSSSGTTPSSGTTQSSETPQSPRTTQLPGSAGAPGSGRSPGFTQSPIFYIIVAVVAAVVLVGIILVIAIVKRKRRGKPRKKQADGNDENQQGTQQNNPTDDDDFVEFINDIYQSSDGMAAQEATDSTLNPPLATAAAAAAETGSATSGGGDVYAVVNKQKPAAVADNRQAGHTEGAAGTSDVCAVVDKQGQAGKEVPGTSDVYAQVVKEK